MDAVWKHAVRRFILNHMGQMTQDDVDAWVNEEIELAPGMEEQLEALSQYRDFILRELHQLSPPEVFDMYCKEHPEIAFPDKHKALVRIGKELDELKLFLMNM
ncbi:MAG: hypothetical protein QXJ32_05005 [Thermoplasmata archaeon]